jgi:hypothetical protein
VSVQPWTGLYRFLVCRSDKEVSGPWVSAPARRLPLDFSGAGQEPHARFSFRLLESLCTGRFRVRSRVHLGSASLVTVFRSSTRRACSACRESHASKSVFCMQALCSGFHFLPVDFVGANSFLLRDSFWRVGTRRQFFLRFGFCYCRWKSSS